MSDETTPKQRGGFAAAKIRLLLRLYRARDAAADRPPLNLPAPMTPILLIAAVLLATLLFRLANGLLFAMLEDRLETGFTIEPSLATAGETARLPADLLGVFELIQRIAPDLDVSSEFAANVMPYLEKGELTESERAFLDAYRREKFDTDPLWIENNLLFQVLRPIQNEGDGTRLFAFGRNELHAFLEGLPGLAQDKPEAMGFLEVFEFVHFPAGLGCAGPDALGCRLSVLLAGFVPEPGLFGLVRRVRPPTLEDSLYDINRLDPSFRAERTRIEDTEALIEALFDATAETADTPRRALQAINGPIQWVTVCAALWCALILTIRRMWARFQLDLSDGRHLSLVHGGFQGFRGPWGVDGSALTPVWHAVEHYGSQLLPFRLLRDLVARARRAERTGPSHIGGLVDRYREQVADQEYTIVGWLIMLVPTLGFIGTIYGMMRAMGGAHLIVAAGDQHELESSVLTLSQHLGTAFDTTLIALILAALLEWLRGSTHRQEARAFEGLARRARADFDRLGALLPDAGQER